MTEITRINLVGQQRPWWNTKIVVIELYRLRPRIMNFFSNHRGANCLMDVEQYRFQINELRHATMLEF